MEETKIIKKNWKRSGLLTLAGYKDRGGYRQFLACALGKNSPEKILEMVLKSGLQGRGGASFPTGEKWQSAKRAAKKLGKAPFFVVNADESQPGTFKDRLIMEKNPHAVIEGALIAAYALRAPKIFIYVNGKYWEQLQIMKQAVEEFFRQVLDREKQAAKKWGEREIEVVQGAGGYIFGEETTLVNSLGGKRGEPRQKPPYPSEKGLLGRPTVVNNLETVANLVPLLESGVEKYRQLGTKGSPGTKLFTILGTVQKEGVYELPLGVKLKELLEIAGGLKKGKELAWIQVGGAGNFFTRGQLDTRLTYEKGERNASAGLGNVLVVDKETKIEDLILSWAQFYERESCGQCTPCREGTYQLLKIAERLREGKLLERDWENLKAIVEVLEKTSYCPLGKFAARNWKGVMRLYRGKFFASDFSVKK